MYGSVILGLFVLLTRLLKLTLGSYLRTAFIASTTDKS